VPSSSGFKELKKVILPGLLGPKNEYTITLQNSGTTHPVSQHYIPENMKLHLQHCNSPEAPILKLPIHLFTTEFILSKEYVNSFMHIGTL
jgi:hypothetical protein